jgi:hypothetical protein
MSRAPLWLQKVALESGRENVVVEHCRSLYVAIAAFLYTKGSIDCERIVVVVDDATSDVLSRKTAPRSSGIPFAAQNVWTAKGRREWIVLHGNPKESGRISIVNCTLTGPGKHSGLATAKTERTPLRLKPRLV